MAQGMEHKSMGLEGRTPVSKDNQRAQSLLPQACQHGSLGTIYVQAGDLRKASNHC